MVGNKMLDAPLTPSVSLLSPLPVHRGRVREGVLTADMYEIAPRTAPP
jgi:hypothetical protein